LRTVRLWFDRPLAAPEKQAMPIACELGATGLDAIGTLSCVRCKKMARPATKLDDGGDAVAGLAEAVSGVRQSRIVPESGDGFLGEDSRGLHADPFIIESSMAARFPARSGLGSSVL